MRTRNSLKNMITTFGVNFFVIVIGLVAQAVFVKTLSSEYLGINGLFNNIISMLSIVDLGIGTAIIYHLYKPVSVNDTNKINSLMQFYKKAYHIVAVIILLIGVCLLPFLHYITGDITISNIYIIYLLFLFDAFCSYILSYKRSILIANQKSYYLNVIHVVYIFILTIIQIMILLFTKNFYFYLIAKIVCRLLENLVIMLLANKKYPFLKNKNINDLDKKTNQEIKTKVKSMIYHKIGAFVVIGSDNILISSLFGIVKVGIYSNYYLIVNAVNLLFVQFLSSLTPSIGNLIVSSKKEEQFSVYKKIRFLNFWISTFTSISLLIIINSFIVIWIGPAYLFSSYIVLALVINYFLQSMRYHNSVFKEAAGIFYEDRWIPVVESILNIVLSLIFANMFGIVGIFIGTICSNLLLHLYSYPKYVYQNLFQKEIIHYYQKFMQNIFTYIVIFAITLLLAKIIVFDNQYLELIKNTMIALLIPNLLLFIRYRKTDEFKYYINLIKNLTKSKKHI